MMTVPAFGSEPGSRAITLYRPGNTSCRNVSIPRTAKKCSTYCATAAGLSLVRGVEVESLEGAVVTLRVVVRGDRDLLGRVAALDGRLQPGPRGGEGAESAVDFVYRP